jgi:multidrug efflux pump subunit AcrB
MKTSNFNPVSWMAQNPVAANLLMALMVLSGWYFMQNIRQEVQPNYTYASVVIEMNYPGASPEAVEQNIVLAIEANIASIEGLARITSTASEGKATIYADIEAGESLDRVLQSVRNTVDNITSFPTDAERPYVHLDDDARWLTTIGISGEASPQTLYALVKRIKNDLLAIDGVIQVTPRVAQQPQISIEIPQAALRPLNLTLSQVAQSIGAATRDIPIGNIQTQGGQYLLRTEGLRQSGLDFADIPLKTHSDGSQVTVADIANITDGFEPNNAYFSYNGAAGMIVYVYQSKNSRTLPLANQVHQYVDQLNATLPESVTLNLPYKRIEKYQARMSMLIDNGIAGLLLVVLVLGLFLTPRLAFWVAVSIPVVFISAFTVLYYLDVSINMISMFAFIMTLGIVIDDAIIVGERIHQKIQQGLSVRDATVQGANDMLVPVLFAVGTNIIAFMPLLMLTGDMGQYLRSLPIVAVVVFSVSLIEALFILPAHLNVKQSTTLLSTQTKLDQPKKGIKLTQLRQSIARGLDHFRDHQFAQVLNWSIKHRYIVVALFTGGLLIILTWFQSNRIEFSWYSQVPSDQVSARLTMPQDASQAETVLQAKQIEAAGLAAIEQLGSLDDVQSRSVSAGINSPTYAKVSFDLVNEAQRDFSQKAFVSLWRKKAGNVPQAQSLTFDYLVGFGSRAGVFVDMSHPSNAILDTAARQLAATLKTINGLVDVSDGLTQGKQQLKYSLTNQAKSLGLTNDELGRQLGAAFYGAQALKMLRDNEQVKVMVRLPAQERDSLNDLDNFIVRAPNGTELFLPQAATVLNSRTFTTIERENGRRNISVGGVVDSSIGNTGLIKNALNEQILPALMAQYPGLKAQLKGSAGSGSGQTPLSQIMTGLGLVCLVIFALAASLFRNYAQGFIVIMTIPYSIAAAVAGHIVMGYSLSANSLFGMVALGGMVVNGALILTSQMNELKKQGCSEKEALIQGAISRFRAIILTALTTTAGLLPMLFETSSQALFLIPFAIALSFGTAFSTFVVLLLIPAFHGIHQDFTGWLAALGRTPTTLGQTKRHQCTTFWM